MRQYTLPVFSQAKRSQGEVDQSCAVGVGSSEPKCRIFQSQTVMLEELKTAEPETRAAGYDFEATPDETVQGVCREFPTEAETSEQKGFRKSSQTDSHFPCARSLEKYGLVDLKRAVTDC
ncbi:hypothetical protein AC579_6009 [Pseudocercospora musae]|uniref:Uncharacterized protein n=1 Tax=Pseudocercospora musae TaxID=113226 RepID=A0A139H748_9PEZI|nr:hypothetical protein AC579_6009 [Pseudocercospora musae]